MSNLVHTVSSPDGMPFAQKDRATIGVLTGIANAAGAAGATVSTTITLPASADLPADYAVMVSPSQACFWYVSGKTSSGFTVNLVPTTSSASIAAGTFDCTVHA